MLPVALGETLCFGAGVGDTDEGAGEDGAGFE
jgi:hypothetical protein